MVVVVGICIWIIHTEYLENYLTQPLSFLKIEREFQTKKKAGEVSNKFSFIFQ